MTLDFLREQLKLQLILEKILKDKIKVSEEEVKKYYKENKEMFFPGKKFEEVKEQIEEELEYQKISMQTQIWIEELKKKAKIVNTLEKK